MKTTLNINEIRDIGNNNGKRKRNKPVINVRHVNELQSGVFEKALANIFIAKAKNGTLNMT